MCALLRFSVFLIKNVLQRVSRKCEVKTLFFLEKKTQSEDKKQQI